MDVNCDKFLNREVITPEIDSDIIKGRRLSNLESMFFMIQDINFNEEEFEKVINKHIKWK